MRLARLVGYDPRHRGLALAEQIRATVVILAPGTNSSGREGEGGGAHGQVVRVQGAGFSPATPFERSEEAGDVEAAGREWQQTPTQCCWSCWRHDAACPCTLSGGAEWSGLGTPPWCARDRDRPLM